MTSITGAGGTDDALEFVGASPDIGELAKAFEETVADIGDWVDQQQRNFDTRFARWPGKTYDGRKHRRSKDAPEPFPWDGASDVSVYLVNDLINTHSAILNNALRKASVQAIPVESDDVRRASIVSNFVRWLIHSEIKEFFDENEYAVNNLLERGLMCTGQFYDQRTQKVSEMLDLQQIFMRAPQMEQAFEQGLLDARLTDMIVSNFDVTEAAAGKILEEAKENGGRIDVPVDKIVKDRPIIRHYVVGEDIIFPVWTVDIQDAPWIFTIEWYTPQMLRDKIISDKWDENWVEYAAEHLKGKQTYPDQQSEIYPNRVPDSQRSSDNLIRVVRAFQKLTDDNGVANVYETIFSTDMTEARPGEGVPNAYAKSGLYKPLLGEYPFVVSKLEKFHKTLYQTRSYAELAADSQSTMKAMIDSRIDAASLQIPPIMHRAGHAPTRWGPAVRVPYRRPGETHFADVPKASAAPIEIENTIRDAAREMFGHFTVDGNQIEAQAKIQALVNLFLSHVSRQISQLYTLYQQFGKDSTFFRVIGDPEMQTFQRGKPGERFDFYFSFDILSNDTEVMESKIKNFIELMQLDKSGMFSHEKVLTIAGELIDPIILDRIIEPQEIGRAKAEEEERQALAQISAGMDLDVPETDQHEIKMQVLQQYIQGSEDIPALDVQERLSSDQAFAARIQKRIKQRQFQLQQRKNAVTGRLGAPEGNLGAA